MEEQRRYVGLDVGKRTYEMAVVENGKTKMSGGATHETGRLKLYGKLKKTDKVALEAGNLAFEIAKGIIERVGCEVVVLNPGKLAVIYSSMKKTDKEDALKLARIVQYMPDEMLPVVPLPSEWQLRMRRLISDYSRNRRQRAQLLNVLHSQFVHQGLTTIVKKDIATAERRAKAIELLSGEAREEAQWILKHLDLYEKRLQELRERIQREAEGNPEARRLQTIDGVGPLVALAYVAYVGDGQRFGNASQVSNYLGLVPRVDISGTIVRYGNITKRGNTYLRSLLVQAGWALVRSKKEGALKNRYLYMTQEKGLSKKKSIVAVARKLAELMFTLLRTETDYEIRPFKSALAKEVARQAISA